MERRICFNIPENQWIRGKTTTTRGPYGKITNRKKTWKPANQGSPTKEQLHSKSTLHFTGTPTTQTQEPGKNLQPMKNRQYSRTVHQGKLRPREFLLIQQEKFWTSHYSHTQPLQPLEKKDNLTLTLMVETGEAISNNKQIKNVNLLFKHKPKRPLQVKIIHQNIEQLANKIDKLIQWTPAVFKWNKLPYYIRKDNFL